MKENINILFLKHVGNHLDGENLKYLVIQKDENNYIIKDIPITFTGYISSLSDYLCYDYDELSNLNQARYEKMYKSLKKVNTNIYSIQTKKYVKRKQSFT